MNYKTTMLLTAALTMSFATASSANAQYGVGGCGNGYGCYFDIAQLYRVLEDNVPHYAAFPPVYYSQPVPRTYGYSPFAYPPGYMTPEVAAPQPVAIDNPYYEKRTSEASAPVESSVDKSAATPRITPLVVENPYVLNAKRLLQTAAK